MKSLASIARYAALGSSIVLAGAFVGWRGMKPQARPARSLPTAHADRTESGAATGQTGANPAGPVVVGPLPRGADDTVVFADSKRLSMAVVSEEQTAEPAAEPTALKNVLVQLPPGSSNDNAQLILGGSKQLSTAVFQMSDVGMHSAVSQAESVPDEPAIMYSSKSAAMITPQALAGHNRAAIEPAVHDITFAGSKSAPMFTTKLLTDGVPWLLLRPEEPSGSDDASMLIESDPSVHDRVFLSGSKIGIMFDESSVHDIPWLVRRPEEP